MNAKRLTITFLLAVCASAPATAACPPPVAGDTPEAVEANQQRLVCLQRELAANGERYQYKVQLDSIQRSIDDIQLQRRFDSLQFQQPTTPQF